MTNRSPDVIRNVALVGGPKAGKTTLAEALLHKAGAIPRQGSVTDGTTVSDFDPEEKDKEHSIALGVLHADTKGHRLNVLDAPGYPDFIGEAATALAAAETALLCVNAAEGLTFAGRKAYELARTARRAIAVVVTHLDTAEVDWGGFVAELGEQLGARCLPVVAPDATGAAFSSVARVPFGADAEGELATLRDALIEAVVEVDEDAMLAFLEEDTPPDEDAARKLLTRSMVAGEVLPVLGVNAENGTGVGALIEFLTGCAPSPVDGPFYETEGGEPIAPDGPAVAYVFKTRVDPYVGKLALLRVVSGEIAHGAHLHLVRTEKNEKLGALTEMQGKESKSVETAVAGDLVAVAKMETLETFDTLRDPASDVVLPPFPVPKPMVARAIEATAAGEEAKIANAMKKAAAEDPTFLYERDPQTGELVAHGVSLMHVETIIRRMKERSGVELEVKLPRVPFLETCTIKAEGHHRHKKQTGGRGQFAEVYLWVQPAERGAGLDFQDDTVGGSVPKQYIPAVEKGVREEMSKGIYAGYTVVDVEVHLTDGKYHDVDSDEASFKLAGARAFRDAFLKAKPVLIEPIFDLEVAVPTRFMGAVNSDLNTRRAHIQGMDSLGETQIIKARAPQVELLTYPTALRSLTQGEASYTAEFHDYEIMPPNVQQEVAAKFERKDDD